MLIKLLAGKEISSYFELLKAIDELAAQEEFMKEETLEVYKDTDLLFSQVLMWFRDSFSFKKKKQKKNILFFYEFLSLLKKQDLAKIPSLEKVHEWIEKAKLGLERNMKLKNCLAYLFCRFIL